VRGGGLSPRVAEHVMDVASRPNRLISAQDFYGRLKEHATDTKTSPEQILLRETARLPRAQTRALEGGGARHARR
jgi:hypothetical protein